VSYWGGDFVCCLRVNPNQFKLLLFCAAYVLSEVAKNKQQTLWRAKMAKAIESNRYECLDAEGHSYIVVEIQEFVEQKTLQGISSAKGLKRLQLPNGNPVNFVDDRTFELVLEEVRVTRVGC
jgi:hypothetical protein